ncbi:MAG: SUMF1/EgtB/PvdO family nonheme iron enzyme [Acidobacteriota bacterium]
MNIIPEYLAQFDLTPDASQAEIEAVLSYQEKRCQVLLKIPIKRSEGALRLELIGKIRELLDQPVPTARGNSQESLFDLFPNLESEFEREPIPFVVTPESPARNESVVTIIEREVINDEAKLESIRRTLNQWANSIPHHEYLTFGSDITILTAEQQPIYFVRLAMVNETRLLCQRQSPYLGEPLPMAATLHPDTIAIWELALPEKRGYHPESIEHTLAASRYRLGCPRCQSQGEMWCTTCQSSGVVLCPQCNGRYQFTCSACEGRGMTTARSTDNMVSCSQCRGAGVVLCGYCRDGWYQCNTCMGYRRITCSECAGRGEIVHSLSIQASYQMKNTFATVFPTNLPDYVIKYFESERYESSAGVALSLEGGRQPDDRAITEIKHELLQAKIGALLKRTLAEIKPQERLYKHLLEVRRCSAIQVRYSFEESNYELWIIGEQGDVYCRTSPIHEYDQKLAKQAALVLADNDPRSCLENLEWAFRHTPNSASGLVVLNECVKKISLQLNAGHYYQVLSIAKLAEHLLGPSLAINFMKMSAQAALKMRLEYAMAATAVGILTLLAALGWLNLNGEIYALNVTLTTGLITLVISITALTLLLATRLASRIGRLATAALVSAIVVLGSSLSGIAAQEEYLARQKREAQARFGRGDYESAKYAIEPLESAIWAAPRDLELQLMLGRAYVRATYYEKAIQSLNVALELSNGRNAEVHNEMGLALLGKGENEKASEHFRRAIALRVPETYLEAYENLARCWQMAYLEGDNFVMGRAGIPLEDPPHTVKVAAFFIDRYEVSNKQYLEFVRATGHRVPADWIQGEPAAGTENWPVTGVNLTDARTYTKWRAERTGFPFRLPSEAEWEFAARGRQNRLFPWGNEFKSSLANVRGSEGRRVSVGSFPKGASPSGVEDLIGNAAEWVEDPLKPYPGSSAIIPANGLWVIRGGSYATLPEQASATTRTAAPAEGGDYREVGFRCVLSAETILSNSN